MSLMSDYIRRNFTAKDYEEELTRLIKEYNKIRGTYLLVYSTDMVKRVPGHEMIQDDYYTICGLLDNLSAQSLDVYVETPGGSGNTAEEIVKFVRSKFENVSFVISAEAKSAGTILVLSGDEILMTSTGSLGPIDAQVQVGRTRVSAYDYVEWLEEKRKEAASAGKLNPVDAVMVAQVSPGEYRGVFHALKYAEDLVKEWLPKYKFKNWTVSETQGRAITEEDKRKRAGEIAEALTKHSEWRDHGRSIKREELESIVRLKVIHTESVAGLDEVVKRIHTVIRLYFGSSQVFKIFATADDRIVKMAATREARQKPQRPPGGDTLRLEAKCEKCGRTHKLYGKFKDDPAIDQQQMAAGYSPIPKDSNIRCDCGFTINLGGLINHLEMQFGKKVIR